MAPPPKGIRPYDWALRQIRVPAAHRITRGSRLIVVALIDIGYRRHPAMNSHLWVNPRPRRGDVHGWDFADDDASLEYTGADGDTSAYYRGHHVFVAGEIAAVAPRCPIMILRVGYAKGRHQSWSRAVRYAVDHGARVIVQPHGYLQGQTRFANGLFAMGTDFAFPGDNPAMLAAHEYAYAHDVLIFKGVADNRGRRVASCVTASPAVFAVASANRRGTAANITPLSETAEAAAPGGERDTRDPRDQIWGLGGDGNYISFTGGCMAAGFAGGVAALVLSRFPRLKAEELRQALRNTARGANWDGRLGCGILDATAAVSLRPGQLCAKPVLRSKAFVTTQGRRTFINVTIENQGVFDIRRAMVVLFNGDATRPPLRCAPRDNPWKLGVIQLGHALVENIRGFSRVTVPIEVFNYGAGNPRQVWSQVSPLDIGQARHCDNRRLTCLGGAWETTLPCRRSVPMPSH